MSTTPTLGWIRNFRARLVALPLALSGLVAVGCAAQPLAGMEKEIRPADLEARKTVGAKAGGLVVWTSSRAGLPHIFSMKTDGSDVNQLTTGDFTDFRPRFSPDGKKILFQRSHEAGFVREGDANAAGAWDLYTIDPAGGALTEVVEDGTWGSWSAPDEIVFVRGSRIMRQKLGADHATKIIDTAHYPFFDGAIVEQPELSHDGHYLALTLAGSRRAAGIWNIRKRTWTEMGQGAQIAWAPDGASVYWADETGKEGSRIAREPVVAGTPADERDPDKILLVDLPGKRSRERFPRLSADGKWLVFGAAVNDLEDDLEDYELFLWQAGSEPTSATRLTFHTTNDSWPDVFVGEPAASAGAEASAARQDEGASDQPAKAETPDEGAKAASSEADAESAARPSASADEAADASPPPAHTKRKSKKRRRTN